LLFAQLVDKVQKILDCSAPVVDSFSLKVLVGKIFALGMDPNNVAFENRTVFFGRRLDTKE
jgi:hypothetical protein